MVYDQGPGYVAVTEFCMRAVAASGARNVVWIDPRYHLTDMATADLPPDLLIVAPKGGIDSRTLLELMDWVFLGQWQIGNLPVLCVVDSLPALTDIGLQPDVLGQALRAGHRYCVEHGGLLVVGNYAVAGERGLSAVGCRQLNALAHTQVVVKHEGDKFGVSVPVCRQGLPVHTWSWADARLVVGQ